MNDFTRNIKHTCLIFIKHTCLIFLDQCLDLIKEKDIIIHEMIKELEQLVDDSIYETKAFSEDLFKLNKIATNKIQTINEEYKKNNLYITVSNK